MTVQGPKAANEEQHLYIGPVLHYSARSHQCCVQAPVQLHWYCDRLLLNIGERVKNKQNLGDATNTCKTARARARAKNYLKYVFQMFKAIYTKALLGFITNLLLDALQKYIDGYLAATNMDVSGTVTIAIELVYLLKFIAPPSYKDKIQIYIDRVRAFQATIRECTGNKDCNGPIPFMIMVLQVPANTVDSTLKCNTLNVVGCAPGKALKAVIDRLKGLQNGMPGVTVTTAKASVATLKTTVCGVAVVDVVCPLANYVDDSLTWIAQCLNSP
ncbi:hypothetical protein CPB97_005247 [Podila verticillata]|nr:hypothetical protein CPB97_005247 [Podila verticillata]